MVIKPNIFVRAMTKHWETNLKLTASRGLQEVWGQIARTFNNQIKEPCSEQWQVLQPPTGTGKTQCMLTRMPFTKPIGGKSGQI